MQMRVSPKWVDAYAADEVRRGVEVVAGGRVIRERLVVTKRRVLQNGMRRRTVRAEGAVRTRVGDGTYRLSVELVYGSADPAGGGEGVHDLHIDNTRCSCMSDAAGRCRHTAAIMLLLASRVDEGGALRPSLPQGPVTAPLSASATGGTGSARGSVPSVQPSTTTATTSTSTSSNSRPAPTFAQLATCEDAQGWNLFSDDDEEDADDMAAVLDCFFAPNANGSARARAKADRDGSKSPKKNSENDGALKRKRAGTDADAAGPLDSERSANDTIVHEAKESEGARARGFVGLLSEGYRGGRRADSNVGVVLDVGGDGSEGIGGGGDDDLDADSAAPALTLLRPQVAAGGLLATPAPHPRSSTGSRPPRDSLDTPISAFATPGSFTDDETPGRQASAEALFFPPKDHLSEPGMDPRRRRRGGAPPASAPPSLGPRHTLIDADDAGDADLSCLFSGLAHPRRVKHETSGAGDDGGAPAKRRRLDGHADTQPLPQVRPCPSAAATLATLPPIPAPIHRRKDAKEVVSFAEMLQLSP